MQTSDSTRKYLKKLKIIPRCKQFAEIKNNDQP